MKVFIPLIHGIFHGIFVSLILFYCALWKSNYTAHFLCVFLWKKKLQERLLSFFLLENCFKGGSMLREKGPRKEGVEERTSLPTPVLSYLLWTKQRTIKNIVSHLIPNMKIIIGFRILPFQFYSTDNYLYITEFSLP